MRTLHSIQALRAFAALLVVTQHVLIAALYGFGGDIPDGLRALGSAGVLTFFVISGFIIVYTSDRHLGSPGYVPVFLRRRLVRIFPTYWMLALINLPVLAMIGSLEDVTVAEVLRSLALAPGSAEHVNLVGWIWPMRFSST